MDPYLQGKIDAAVASFPAELGRQLREQRTSAGLSEEQVAAMLARVGVPLSEGDVALLEAGQRTEEPDLRLLAALMFLFDTSTDRVLAAGLRGGGPAPVPSPSGGTP